MIVASVAEVLSISAVLPFLGVLISPEKIFGHELAQPLIALLHVETTQDLLLLFTLIFILTASFSGLARIALLWVQTRLSMAISADFSAEVYERTLYQPYILHVSRNSSEILAGAAKAGSLIGYIIQPTLIILSSLLILLAVIFTLLAIQPFMALSAFLGFGLIYAAVVFITKRRIVKNSQAVALQQGRVTKAIQEGLGGIRNVLIDGAQLAYLKLYKDAVIPMKAAQASNEVVATSPRFGVEALGVIFIAGLAYVLVVVTGAGATDAVPVLGALALGAQRLLPLLQQIYAAFITIKGNQASTQDALNLLDQPMPAFTFVESAEPIEFHAAVTLKDLGFRYTSEGPWVLRHLDLEIPRGSRVGFVGVTGSGKSTLIDIIVGLLAPTEGKLLIDNVEITPENARAWQSHISHVPQEIFLADISIAENIAFGVPTERIDLYRVKQVSQQAQIAQVIESWSNGYDTLVGERGVRLSGGQRQRIGLARALYKQADVLVLDEATSSLDDTTERSVIEAIRHLNPNLTILMIAHRLSTLKNCTLIFELDLGRIIRTLSYAELIHSKPGPQGNPLSELNWYAK
jgi:ABC-type bacteriocin/lantibiotic exporter with double-glycine peptidase domain